MFVLYTWLILTKTNGEHMITFKEIKKDCVNTETIYSLYVLSLTRKIIGVIDLKTLLLANPKDKIRDIF